MKLYFRILRYIKPYRMLVVLSLLCSIIFVAMNTLSVWMIGSLISTIINPADTIPIPHPETINGTLKSFTQYLIGTGTKTEQLQTLCILMILIFMIKNIFLYISRVAMSFTQNRLISDIRNQLFEHMQRLSISFYDKNKTSEMTSILINDVDRMRSALTQSLHNLIIEPFNIILFIFLLFIISPKMTIISILVIPTSGFCIIKIGSSLRRRAKRASIQIAELINTLQESLSGIRIIKAFSMEKYEINRFIKENLKYFNLLFKQDKLSNLVTPINDMVGVTIAVILLWVGGTEVFDNQGLTPDDFMKFILLLFAVMQPIKKLGSLNAQIQTGLASSERVFSILDSPIVVRNPKQPIEFSSFKKEIAFNDVSFQYELGETLSLKNINVKIKKGDVVAIVGTSGAGKTTFIDLMPRFYDISNGEITIDDINIKDIKIKDLRKTMGVVTQNTILFNDSVYFNISYGMPNVSKEDVIAAAKAANAHDFINSLPEKYDTVIGERGVLLSGGQKQRISIARAILKNPEVLILDEATSSLDSESEVKVQQAIDKLIENRTVIIIAHRFSTIKNSDKILVFDNGEITEEGTHEQLYSKDGLYTKLYKLQFNN